MSIETTIKSNEPSDNKNKSNDPFPPGTTFTFPKCTKESMLERTDKFAKRILSCFSMLRSNRLPKINRQEFYHARSQLIRSSSSVAANYRAAVIAQSRKAFAAKLSICAEEAYESAYWLDYIFDMLSSRPGLGEESFFKKIRSDRKYDRLCLLPMFLKDLNDEANQLTKIFVSSRKSAERKIPINDPIDRPF
jgi:four helix bundle protein